MEKFIIFFLLFLLPFVVWPQGYFQFEIPKVILAQLLIIVLISVTLFKNRIKLFFRFSKAQTVLFTGIFLLTLYDLIFLITPISFFGNQARLQGILLLWLLLSFSLISSKIRLPKIPSFVFFGILLSITILSLFIGNANGRAVATIGEPNALSAFIIFLWPFIFFSKNLKSQTLIRLAAIICVGIIILLSGSRSGLIAFLIQAAFYFSIKIGKVPLKKAIIISIILIVISYSLPFFGKTLYENRTDIWNTSIVAGFSKPILGSGFGNNEVVLKQTSFKLLDRLRGYYVDSTHNILLDWWVQGGFVGLILMVLLLYTCVKHLYKEKKEFELILLLGLFVMLSFNPPSVITLLTFWWTIGRSFTKDTIYSKHKAPHFLRFSY